MAAELKPTLEKAQSSTCNIGKKLKIKQMVENESIAKIIMPFHNRAFPLVDRVSMYAVTFTGLTLLPMWSSEL